MLQKVHARAAVDAGDSKRLPIAETSGFSNCADTRALDASRNDSGLGLVRATSSSR
jgi:hypothetical protein